MITRLILICKGVFQVNKITLKQAYDLFIFDRQTFCLDKTIENYRNTIRYFCNFMEQKYGLPADRIYLSDITPIILKEYVLWLRSRPMNMDHPFKESGGNLSKRSIRNYTVDLKTFLKHLHQEGYMEDVASGLKVMKAEKKAIIPLSASDVKLIDSYLNRKTVLGSRNYCMVHLMLDAGLRFHEVCTLTLPDLNFDNRYIRIHGKGAKERIVPMAVNLRQYLYQYIIFYRPASDSNAVFLSSRQAPVTDSVIKTFFARMRKRTGIDRLHPHLLRHTFATCYILGGGSVEMLRILLGHESISTTQIYMHLAAVYEFQDGPYVLDSIFFKSYSPLKHR